MRWRASSFLVCVVALTAVLALLGSRPDEQIRAVGTDPATPAIDYGATMTVLAGNRMPQPEAQRIWETYFTEIGAQAASSDGWPRAFTVESVDVDYDLDQGTKAIRGASGEYELETPGRDYASVLVLVRASDGEAHDEFSNWANGTEGTSWEAGAPLEIGEEAACLFLRDGANVVAHCTARTGDTLVTGFWMTGAMMVDGAQQQAVLLTSAFFDAVALVERPER